MRPGPLPDHSIVTVAAPIQKRGTKVAGIVAVSVSLRGISQLQRAAGLVALVGAHGWRSPALPS